MKVLFIISNSETAFWLSEVTHPYWHLTERGVEVDFASPAGGKVVYDPYSNPYFQHSTEPDDLGGGPGCLNSFSASISGASASVRLPSGEAAG
jgi:putative intracellular protease/amidase